jgi:hypothetical protein
MWKSVRKTELQTGSWEVSTMISSVLLLASLVTMQTNHGDYWPSVSCNKQGTAFDSVWQTNTDTNAAGIYYQRNTNGTAPSDSNGTPLPPYSMPGSTSSLLPPTYYIAPAGVDTDDSSSSNPNFAAVWIVTYNFPSPAPSITIPICSVNGHASFPVGYYNGSLIQQGAEACVAVSRQLTTYGGQTVMVVAIAFQSGESNIYAQVFLVNPSTGGVVTQSTAVQLNSSPPGQPALGGIAGDDYGNFVVGYVRQNGAERQPPLQPVPPEVCVVGFNYQTLFNNPPTLGFGEYVVEQLPGPQQSYAWCRVACYHGTAANNGGFVVAYSGPAITAMRYTTNWSSAPTLAATVAYSEQQTGLPSSEPQTAWFSIACQRDEPGTYVLTWASQWSTAYEDLTQLNTLYAIVSGDEPGPVIFLTDYIGEEYPPPPWARTPSVALGDSAWGSNYQFDYCYSASNTSTAYIQAVWGAF